MKKNQECSRLVIRFAGDSGDGIQIIGQQFASVAANFGNDVKTYPDYPAEIRAPSGTLAGVSGFQIHFAGEAIYSPGDEVDVLVAMNPAALKVHLTDVRPGGTLIINSDTFRDKEFKKADFTDNPLEDGSLDKYNVESHALTTQTLAAVESFGLGQKQAKQCKNFYALGIALWMFDKTLVGVEQWLADKFGDDSILCNANRAALQAGFNFAETVECAAGPYFVASTKQAPGSYRHITGNEAFALACATLSEKSAAKVFVAAYPITPASTLLHTASQYRLPNLITWQAEDEMAAIGAAIGAAFGGQLAITVTSGPGFSLKSELLGFAVMAELPLVVINVQRAGPSTGMPTKVEQSDLNMALNGRHGDAPVPVLAAKSPSDCFAVLLAASRIAVKHMTPVVVLSDASIALGAEPWLIPDLDSLDVIDVPSHYAKKKELKRTNLTPPWFVPGTEGCEIRLGGLEKDRDTGSVSYDPSNHAEMSTLRRAKVNEVVTAPIDVFGAKQAKLAILTWGSPFGVVREAVTEMINDGVSVSHLHCQHLNPLPADIKQTLDSYEQVLVAELNEGQLAHLIQAQWLTPCLRLNKVSGKPFLKRNIIDKVRELIA